MKILLGILLLVANFAAAESASPNVVLCMADDHGWGDTGYNGHPFLRTPQLDAMAASGIRFDRWYAAAPVCSPTRGTVFSPPWDNGFDTCFSTESKVPTFDPMLTPSKVSRESKGTPGSPSGLIVDRTLRFVAEAAKKKKPFLAVYGSMRPTPPWSLTRHIAVSIRITRRGSMGSTIMAALAP